LWKLKDTNPVLFIYKDEPPVLLVSEACLGLVREAGIDSAGVHFPDVACQSRLLDVPNLVRIWDPQARATHAMACFTVVVSSPNEAKLKDFVKGVGNAPVKRLYMDLWTLAELQACARLFRMHNATSSPWSDDEVAERFQLFGGAARPVLQDKVWNDRLEEDLGKAKIRGVGQAVCSPRPTRRSRGT